VKKLMLALFLLVPSAAGAQVQVGTTFKFDHDPESALDTEKYQLCVDGVSDILCRDIAVLREEGTNTYSFSLPSWTPKGNRTFAVRAVGKLSLGTSGPSNTVSERVMGKPEAPTNLRKEP
jgi:hypothetical protein